MRGGGKKLADGRRAFLAKIEDNNSLADLAGDVESLTTLEADAVYAAAKQAHAQQDPLVECGSLKAHANNNGVRLTLNLSMSLRSSLSDRERRLLALGEAFQKKVNFYSFLHAHVSYAPKAPLGCGYMDIRTTNHT